MFFYFELFIIRVRSPHLAAPLDECLDLLRQSNYRVSQKKGDPVEMAITKVPQKWKEFGCFGLMEKCRKLATNQLLIMNILVPILPHLC